MIPDDIDTLDLVKLEKEFNNEIVCKFCRKTFTRKDNRNYHEKHCESNRGGERGEQTNSNQSHNPETSRNQVGEGEANDSEMSESVMISSFLNSASTLYRVQFGKNEINAPVALKESLGKLKQVIRSHVNPVKYYFSLSIVFQKFSDENQLTDPPVVFRSSVFRCLASTDINKNIDSALEQIIQQIEDYEKNGSGWVIHHIIHNDVSIVIYDPLKASSYIRLPNKLSLKKAILNIQNFDDKCFLWSILAQLYPTELNQHQVENYLNYENILNMIGISYQVTLQAITRFEN